jgi:integral membrane protein
MVSLAEGCSTLILFFVAMPLKYIWDIPEAVRWPGLIHGALFVLLVCLALLALKKVPLSFKLCAIVLLASFIPFAPFFVDRKLRSME